MSNFRGLGVTIDNVEFAKSFHYFLTLQIDSSTQKYRTDVSASVTNPIFSTNTFCLPLKGGAAIEAYQRLHFAGFVVTDKIENLGTDLETKGQAKLLGECAVDIDQYVAQLSDTIGLGVKATLQFKRQQGTKSVTVGRFVCTLKLLGDYQMDTMEEEKGGDMMHLPAEELPSAAFGLGVRWRLRVDIRSGIDAPLNKTTRDGLPSMYVEVGWSKYKQQLPSLANIVSSSVVEHNQHPLWNQQILYNNPNEADEPNGYFWIIMKDKFLIQPLESVVFPLTYLKPFQPAHLELIRTPESLDVKFHLYLSFTLETAVTEMSDKLVNVIIKWVDFDPLPFCTNKFMVLLTTQGYTPSKIPFAPVDLGEEVGISKGFQANMLEYQTYISTISKIPPERGMREDSGVANFIMPKSYIDEKVQIFIAVEDNKELKISNLPASIIGFTDILDQDLEDLYYSASPSPRLFPVKYNSSLRIFDEISSTKMLLHLSCVSLQDTRPMGAASPKLGGLKGQGLPYIDKERESHYGTMGKGLKGIEGDFMGTGGVDNREKWQLLSKELAQKQELINRMMREVDEKSQALKLTGAEIIDLRRSIKMLQSENAILRKKLGQEEEIQLQNLVTKEISRMGIDELRNKILKMAQAYRTERIRNEEFEKALKSAQMDIIAAKKVKAELEALQSAHEAKGKKLLEMQREVQKVNLYKDTVKKQEKVINKLETLLSRTVKDTKQAREDILELEQLKTQNLQLQNKIKKSAGFGTSIQNEEIERYRKQISFLEGTVEQLKEELRNKRPPSSSGDDWQREKLELEVHLMRSQAKIDGLEEELTSNATQYGKEIGQLKAILMEKQSIIDNMAGSSNDYQLH